MNVSLEIKQARRKVMFQTYPMKLNDQGDPTWASDNCELQDLWIQMVHDFDSDQKMSSGSHTYQIPMRKCIQK